jgi:hypothetical protein
MDKIQLIVKPDVQGLEWSDFKGPFNIAIDGYVAEAPKFDEKLPCANFNHHEGVSRLETRATSAQILLSIRMGLFDTFRENGVPKAFVFANDCDEDVCLSYFLLKHSTIAESMVNPLLNKLVSVAELMDTTGGMLPLSPDFSILQDMAWIFNPYREFRTNGGLDRRISSEFSNIIEQVCNRIMSFITGSGESRVLDTSYTKIGGGNGWAMIREDGTYGRQGALKDGIRAFVSVRERCDGVWSYSVGRMSEFVPFPIHTILMALNSIEARERNTSYELLENKWGGSTTIAGSPRTTGSVLTPSMVEGIVNQALLINRKDHPIDEFTRGNR